MPSWFKNLAKSILGTDAGAQLKHNGDVRLDAGDWPGAAAFYRQAVAVDPNAAGIWSNLGFSLMQQGLLDDAAAAVGRALALNPALFNAHYILGTIAYRLGQLDEALQHFRNATAINADFAEAFDCIGNVLIDMGDNEGAAQAYRRAIDIDPDQPGHYCNLAGAVLGLGRRDEAFSHYRRALELAPAFNAARLNLVHQMQKVCDWKDIDAHIGPIRQHVLHAPFDPDSRESPFSFLALPGATAQEQRVCAETWTRSNYASQMQQQERTPFNSIRAGNPKIRVGYLSADFHTHATAMLMAQVFELHDRECFHITAYSYGPDDGSDMRARLESAFDEFVDIEQESIVDSARRIARDGIDILVDLKGYTGGSRSAILALRPAPIQVNYLGYPGTMGAGFVDYLIADRFVIPPGQQSHYSEKIAYLPDCYQPNDRMRPRPQAPTRTSLALPEDGVVFCCFNQTYKVTPQMFDVWCRLLAAVPGSVLWLLADTSDAERNLRDEAKRRGVRETRLVFAPRVPVEQHLARLQCADLFLDTLPYNAHTTCSEALWMGLPVITCAGETFASRVAGSLLSALQVPELIAFNLTDYFDAALELASDHGKRQAIRNKICANIETAPLFDSALFTANLESVFKSMQADR